eukprot:12421791-Karenia_brevis.AAC.1
MKFRPQFLREFVEFSDEDAADEADINAWWTGFGVSGEFHDKLVDFNLVWHREKRKLLVMQKHQKDPEIVTKLSSCLAYVFEFRKFSDSRWLSLAPCCRTLIASVSIGLEGIVCVVQKH